MPAEALENQILDAIVGELQKIGLPPYSNWLTTDQPALVEGPPGDRAPGPNLPSLFVHHISSQEGSDAAGATSHVLSTRFAVWCCHSDPAAGQRKVLNLRQDVVRALRAAEGTFYELFQYGLTVGECQYTGFDESYIQGGVAACMQIVTVDAYWPTDGELRAGATALSIDLERTLLRVYPFSALPPIERSTPGITQRLEAPSLIIETTTPGANKLLESRIEGVLSDQFFRSAEGALWHQYETEIAALVSPTVGANATDTMYAGIEIGTYNEAAPFPTAAGHPVAQLRWNFGLSRWELVSGVGDGSTPDLVVPLTGVPALTPGIGGGRLRLVYDPFTPQLLAYVDGKLGALVTDSTRLPQFAAAVAPLVHGAFATTGASAAGSVQAFFSAVHCKLYNPALAPATLWY